MNDIDISQLSMDEAIDKIKEAYNVPVEEAFTMYLQLVADSQGIELSEIEVRQVSEPQNIITKALLNLSIWLGDRKLRRLQRIVVNIKSILQGHYINSDRYNRRFDF